MNILMILPRKELNGRIDYSYVFPLGLAYISAMIKKKGYEVDCLNLNHFSGDISKIVEDNLNKKKYDCVCTGANSMFFKTTKIILEIAKNHPSQPKTILGGIMITSEPSLVFNLLNPDVGVIGEGEETILEVLDAIKNKKNFLKIKGIIFKNKKNKVCFTPSREPPKDLDILPIPDFDGFEFGKQLDNTFCNTHYSYQSFDFPRVYPILGSRGCPFNCTFCYHYSRYRKRSVKNILDELNYAVKKYKINIILFFDECLALDKERLMKFCAGIKKIQSEISWELRWAPQLTVHNVDDDLLKKLKDSGVDTISYGFESMSPEVLKSMNKPITPKMIDNAFKKTLKHRINVQANFIFGDIAETKKTAKQTLDYWRKN